MSFSSVDVYQLWEVSRKMAYIPRIFPEDAFLDMALTAHFYLRGDVNPHGSSRRCIIVRPTRNFRNFTDFGAGVVSDRFSNE